MQFKDVVTDHYSIHLDSRHRRLQLNQRSQAHR